MYLQCLDIWRNSVQEMETPLKTDVKSRIQRRFCAAFSGWLLCGNHF